MSADDAPVTMLSEDECWSLLSSMSLGRVVTILGGKPEIFPVNSPPNAEPCSSEIPTAPSCTAP